MEIGAKLKQLRLQCGMTQDEVASRCDLTKGYISQLENELTSPSIATLIDILSALGSDLPSFFKEEAEEQIVFSSADFFEKQTEENKITWLVPNSQKNEMEPILMEISPATATPKDMPHEGEEFGYVLAGAVMLHLGKRVYKVKSGESFYFVSSKEHFLKNEGKTTAKIIWVSSPPTF
ncbi:MAG TPA: XRE family transcriptional regulator [Clostridia bacterium]|nr:XRE family transcriptional regulator [Clostridia bacterium]HRU84727.1 XRE family transcriptional regulator [Eubacteriales bacterium]